MPYFSGVFTLLIILKMEANVKAKSGLFLPQKWKIS